MRRLELDRVGGRLAHPAERALVLARVLVEHVDPARAVSVRDVEHVADDSGVGRLARPELLVGVLPVGQVDLVDDLPLRRGLEDQGVVVRVVQEVLALLLVVLEAQAVRHALRQAVGALLAQERAVRAVGVEADQHLRVVADVGGLEREVDVARGVARDAVAVEHVSASGERGGRHLEQLRLVLVHLHRARLRSEAGRSSFNLRLSGKGRRIWTRGGGSWMFCVTRRGMDMALHEWHTQPTLNTDCS